VLEIPLENGDKVETVAHKDPDLLLFPVETNVFSREI
jgi:hypothetical protein